MRKIAACFFFVSLMTACSPKYVEIINCPKENHSVIVNFVEMCDSGIQTCSAEAKKLFCKVDYVKNPNHEGE